MMKKLAKICLGTVQLGMKYGIKNELGRQPSNEEAFGLLDWAVNNGIKSFDTASAYGNAENVLGEFGIGQYPVKVISKLKSDSRIDISKEIQHEVEKSLRRLKLQNLDGYLLHDAKDFYSKDIMIGLINCKEKGLVKNIGVSIYEPEDALQVAKSGSVDYIQIPYNVFDRRLDQTEFFEVTKKNKIRVFARSAFLQGLLLIDIKKIPNGLREVRQPLKKFEQICGEYGFSRVEAALLFSGCHEGIDEIVIGVETKEQLISNFDILKKINEFADCHAVLSKEFRKIEKKIMTPSRWS